MKVSTSPVFRQLCSHFLVAFPLCVNAAHRYAQKQRVSDYGRHIKRRAIFRYNQKFITLARLGAVEVFTMPNYQRVVLGNLNRHCFQATVTCRPEFSVKRKLQPVTLITPCQVQMNVNIRTKHRTRIFRTEKSIADLVVEFIQALFQTQQVDCICILPIHFSFIMAIQVLI